MTRSAPARAQPASWHTIRRGGKPEGRDAGGRIVATGTPEDVASTAGSYTGDYLARVLAPRLADAKRRA